MAANSTLRLRNVCVKIGSGATPRGGKEAYKGGAIALIRSQNVYNEGFHRDGLAFIDEQQAAELNNVEVQANDVLLNITGDSVARCCQVAKDILPARVNQHVAIIRPRPHELDARFLRYVLVSPSMQSHLLALASAGATRNALTKAMLENLKVPAPPLPEQKAIAYILGALDEKIELNQRMNETLEAIAQAIFKSWFVDFDPVRVLSGEMPEKPPFLTADASRKAGFPDRFQDSQLGQIPEGWHVRALGEVLDVKHGYAFEGKYFRDNPPGDILLTPGNFRVGGGYKDDKLKYYCGPVPEGFILNEGDLLLTMTDLSKASDTLGFPALLPRAPTGQRFLHNQRLAKVVITDLKSAGRLFLYRIFCGDDYRNEILASSTGTTVKHTSPDRIKAFKAVFPPPALMAHYEQTALPMYLGAANNSKQCVTIADIRDTLLPKLLSGDLRAV